MFKLLDTVVLNRDLPEHRLCGGDLGAVVDVHPPDGLEVEFVAASGRTHVLVSLREPDLRPAGAEDLMAARLRQAQASVIAKHSETFKKLAK